MKDSLTPWSATTPPGRRGGPFGKGVIFFGRDLVRLLVMGWKMKTLKAPPPKCLRLTAPVCLQFEHWEHRLDDEKLLGFLRKQIHIFDHKTASTRTQTKKEEVQLTV